MFCDDPLNRAVCELFSDIRTQAEARTILTEAHQHEKTLFLDAYDEATELDPRAFCKALKACRIDNQLPNVRIVSRQARIEPSIMSDITSAILGDDSKDSEGQTWTIDGLTLNQINEYASLHISKERLEHFWKEVQKHSLMSMLAWPVNLSAFIEVFVADGQLGLTAADAWRRSVEIQLLEENPLRTLGRKLQPRTGLTERLELAKLLSAADVLCQRFPLTVGHSLPRGLTASTLFSEMGVARPSWASRETDFTSGVAEVIDSRIFETHGGIATFRSLPMAQFLAAEFLSLLSLSQILQLLSDPRSSERICDPASPVAAELARFHQDLFDHLCEHQPDVFLTTVLFSYSDDQRYRIVEAFLLHREYRSHYLRGYYRPDLIKHPRLAEQLRPFLQGMAGDGDDLSLAIDIADYCNVVEVVPELAQIAHDKGQPYTVRTNAADALVSLGVAGMDSLRPFLTVLHEDDPDDELFGAALQALWPLQVPQGEVFTMLRDPQDGTGGYQGFLRYYENSAPFRITLGNVSQGLAWMRDQELLVEAEPRRLEAFNLLNIALVAVAWENIDKELIAESLAELALARIRNASRPLVFALSDEDKKREPYDVPKVQPPGLSYERFLQDRTRRFVLFEAWRRVLDPSLDNRYGYEFMDRRGDSGSRSDLDTLLALTPEGDTDREVVRETISTLSIDLLLNDGLAFLESHEQALQSWDLCLNDLRVEALRIKVQRTKYQRPNIHPDFNLEASLGRFSKAVNADDVSALAFAIECLILGITGYSHQYITPEDSPLWEEVSSEARQEFRERAKAYVVVIPSREDVCFDPRLMWSGALDNAIWLLRWLAEVEEDWCTEHINELIPGLRANYLASNYKTSNNSELIRLNRAVPAQVRATWFADECRAWQKSFDFGRVGPLNEIWSDDLAVEFSNLIGAGHCSEDVRFQMLGAMAVHKAPQVADLLVNELGTPKFRRKSRAVELILTYHVTEAFFKLSQMALRDRTVYEHTWRCLWNRRRIDPLVGMAHFDANVLKRLFNRACKLQPPNDDEPRGKGPRRVTAKMERESMRNALYSALLNQNDPKIWNFLLQWSNKSGFEWIAENVRIHRNKWLEGQWSSPDLSTLAALRQNPNGFFVRSDADLLRLTLRELEVVRIDITENELFNHGTEVQITALVARLLDLQLKQCIVNCEANARPVGKRRTDIQVEVVTPSQKLKCVIEAKRCNNMDPKLDVLKLRSEYLHPSETATGVYLIYRHSECPCSRCKKWNNTELDIRNAVAAKGHRLEWLVWHLKGKVETKIASSESTNR